MHQQEVSADWLPANLVGHLAALGTADTPAEPIRGFDRLLALNMFPSALAIKHA